MVVTEEIRLLKNYLYWRLLLLSILVASSLVFYLISPEDVEIILFSGVSLFAFWTVISIMGIKVLAEDRQRVLTAVQLLSDVFFVTFVVHMTGGVYGTFSFLYLLLIITGSYVWRGFGDRLVNVAATISFLGLYVFELLDPASDRFSAVIQARLDRESIGVVFGILLSFQAVSLLLQLLERQRQKLSRDLDRSRRENVALEAFNELIVTSIPSGILILDTRGVVSFYNPAAIEILESAACKLLGSPIEEIFSNLKGRVRHFGDGRLDLSSLEEGGHGRMEVLYFKGAKKKHVGFSFCRFQQGEVGEKTGFLFLFQDLTSFRVMEEELKRADRLAAVGKLSAGIAHEIRNPLASISGAIELLRSELVLDSGNERLMEIILREINRLNVLISDFLTFAKPTHIKKEHTNLSLAIEDTLALFTKGIDELSIVAIKKQIDENLIIDADPKQIRQVLWNLTKNAIQAMPNGGTLEVWAHWQSAAKSGVVIEVKDSGDGIPFEIQSRIFDPFFTTKEHGTGLGLALVHQIVESHKGTIQFESSAGQGTTFKVLLPVEIEKTVTKDISSKESLAVGA